MNDFYKNYTLYNVNARHKKAGKKSLRGTKKYPWWYLGIMPVNGNMFLGVTAKGFTAFVEEIAKKNELPEDYLIYIENEKNAKWFTYDEIIIDTECRVLV